MKTLVRQSLLFAAVAAAGTLTWSTTAVGQEPDPSMEEVVVQAPLVYRHVEDVSITGVKTELVELRRRVGFADLDLAVPDDVEELQHRIAAVAREACRALDELSPLAHDFREIQRCVKAAIEDAQPQLDRAVAQAH